MMIVSVCMATFNGEKYILKQLESILEQLSENDEIIISDDSSTDNTLEIIESLNNKKIKVFSGQTFKNPIYNFENAIQKSTGNIIFLADQDDIWMPGKVEHLKQLLKNNAMVVTDHSIIDEDDETVCSSYFSLVPSRPGLIKNLQKNTYFGCCMAFKRDVLNYALPFPKDIPMHDIWLGFVADLFFNVKFVNYPYTKYRKHNNNVSNATEFISLNSLATKIKYRFNIIKYLPKLLYKRTKR